MSRSKLNAVHVLYHFLCTAEICAGWCDAEDNVVTSLRMPGEEEILFAVWKYFLHFLIVCDPGYDLSLHEVGHISSSI